MIRYTRYANRETITHDALCADNRDSGDFFARAEDSGSEGCYVEVACWSFERERWERYCFFKFLGGEDQERQDWTPVRLAEHYAREINEAAGPKCSRLPWIHRLPNWGG
jgi:hypothetical protein